MRISIAGFIVLAIIPAALSAQRVAAPVRGTVVDSSGRPIESAEVSVTTAGRLIRTDADGRFEVDTLVTGPNRFLIRRLGMKAIDTVIYTNAKIAVTLHLVMAQVPQALAAVHIVSQDECPTKTLEGFACRRRAGIGAFRDSAELAALGPICRANMFEGMEGLRLVPGVPCPSLESLNGWRCIKTLIDGRPSPAIGDLKLTDYIGVEFYSEEDKVPAWYQTYAFANAQAGHATMARRGMPTTYRTPSLPGRNCALIVYWTHFAPRYDPKLDQDKATTRAMQAHRDSLQTALLDSLARTKP
jgi:Carboxypeptidase regulatory-like domain